LSSNGSSPSGVGGAKAPVASPAKKVDPGSGPPSRSFRLLKHITEYRAVLDELDICETKEGLAEVKQKWKNHKMAFGELISTCKAANKRLELALAAAEVKIKEAANPQPQAASSSRKLAKQTAGAASIALWQVCCETCIGCDEVCFIDDFKIAPEVASKTDPSMPMKFHIDMREFEKKCSDLISAATQQMKKFKLSSDYTTSKRNARRLIGDGLTQAKAVFKNILPNQVEPPSDLSVSDTRCQWLY
jgi:hypothetical protein